MCAFNGTIDGKADRKDGVALAFEREVEMVFPLSESDGFSLYFSKMFQGSTAEFQPEEGRCLDRKFAFLSTNFAFPSCMSICTQYNIIL